MGERPKYKALHMWTSMKEDLKLIHTSDQFRKLKRYKNCFSGKDAVAHVLKFLHNYEDPRFHNADRSQAEKLLQKLMADGAFKSAARPPEHIFTDSDKSLYQHIRIPGEESPKSTPKSARKSVSRKTSVSSVRTPLRGKRKSDEQMCTPTNKRSFTSSMAISQSYAHLEQRPPLHSLSTRRCSAPATTGKSPSYRQSSYRKGSLLLRQTLNRGKRLLSNKWNRQDDSENLDPVVPPSPRAFPSPLRRSVDTAMDTMWARPRLTFATVQGESSKQFQHESSVIRGVIRREMVLHKLLDTLELPLLDFMTMVNSVGRKKKESRIKRDDKYGRLFEECELASDGVPCWLKELMKTTEKVVSNCYEFRMYTVVGPENVTMYLNSVNDAENLMKKFYTHTDEPRIPRSLHPIMSHIGKHLQTEAGAAMYAIQLLACLLPDRDRALLKLLVGYYSRIQIGLASMNAPTLPSHPGPLKKLVTLMCGKISKSHQEGIVAIVHALITQPNCFGMIPSDIERRTLLELAKTLKSDTEFFTDEPVQIFLTSLVGATTMD